MDKKQRVLDIAMNLNRIGNWAADDFTGKKKRIRTFIANTRSYIDSLALSSFREPFKTTFNEFLKQYNELEKEWSEGPRDPLYWGERMMTWGNILTHRRKLITN